MLLLCDGVTIRATVEVTIEVRYVRTDQKSSNYPSKANFHIKVIEFGPTENYGRRLGRLVRVELIENLIKPRSTYWKSTVLVTRILLERINIVYLYQVTCVVCTYKEGQGQCATNISPG